MAEVTAAVAIGWGMKAVGWVASPVISDLFKKASSYLGFDASEKLSELEPKILLLERVMGAVEGSPYRPRLEGLYSKLKSAFYEAEEILDDVEYYRLEKKIQDDRLKSEVAGPSRHLKQIWSAVAKSSPLKHQESGMSKVKLKKKLDRIEEVINDACKVLELMNLPSINVANQSHVIAANSRDSVTTSRPLSTVIGRDEDCDKIIAMLHDKGEHGQPDTNSDLCYSISKKSYSVVGIHGIGGSGKSTLAQLVCSREKKDGHFELVMWVHVSQDFSVDSIFMEMFEAATGTSCPQLTNRNALQDELAKKLHGKCFLLVLDDVWYNIRDTTQSEKLKQILCPLMDGEAGSKILVTSRTEDALLVMGAPKERCIPMTVLDEDVFWNLLMHYALHSVSIDDHARRILGDIGKEIAKKLKGSPLAARIIGGQLRIRQNVEFWRNVRDRDLLNETMGALWWSYHHLREQVKRCFAYCSIFPRRHRLKRNELVRLWAAEGFARCTSEGEEMEDVCQEYFDELVSASFLQVPAKKMSWDEYYLVHDLLHDLAEKAAGSDCFRIETSWELRGKCPAVEFPPNVCHIFVQHYNEELITKKICQLYNLRTLIIGTNFRVEVGGHILKCMFKRLRKLRVLIISPSNKLTARTASTDVLVPASIGQLRHLRYLAFQSGTFSSVVLPVTFTKLYHLQTLDVNHPLKKVIVLPSSREDFCSLVNLRHAVCLEYMGIPSIGRLTSLQTMGNFIVSKEQGHELKQLGNLNKLRGKIWISGLKNVESKAEALEANLACKEGLRTLTLCWGWERVDASPEAQAQVLEGLCPPKDLESLSIRNYGGSRYPSWMHKGGPKHLNHLCLVGCSPQPGPELGGFWSHLRVLQIGACSWDALPNPMEHLTSLQSLQIWSCENIRSLPALPPSLEHLMLDRCDELSMSSCYMEHLTSLQTLKISSCYSIRSLPALPHSIKILELGTSDVVLVRSCITVGNLSWQKIKHIPYVSIDHQGPLCVMKMGVVQDPKEPKQMASSSSQEPGTSS